MKRTLTILSWLLSMSAVCVSLKTAAQTPVAYVGATIHPGGEAEPFEGVIVVSGTRIVSVSKGATVPAGATAIDVKGKVITPGFIATQSALGLVEVEAEASTRNEAPEEGDPIRAAFSAADGYNPESTLIPVARSGGVTSALVTPEGGLVSGTSAMVDLHPNAPPVVEHAALHIRLDDGGVGDAGGAFSMAILRLQELFDDARLYAKNRSAFDKRGLRQMKVSRLDLERVSQALQKKIPVVIRVSRSSDILRTLELAKSYGLDLVLEGVEEGWRVAASIKKAKVPVIIAPMTNLPSSFTKIGSRFDNAKKLHDAGVTLIIASPGAHYLRNLRQEAGNAIAHGLPAKVALAAVSSNPAQVFGSPGRGTLAAGKTANFVVWSGDPFELTEHAEKVVVGGVSLPLTSRQSALRERYRTMPTPTIGPWRRIK